MWIVSQTMGEGTVSLTSPLSLLFRQSTLSKGTQLQHGAAQTSQLSREAAFPWNFWSLAGAQRSLAISFSPHALPLNCC
jgi:hypothetical protein